MARLPDQGPVDRCSGPSSIFRKGTTRVHVCTLTCVCTCAHVRVCVHVTGPSRRTNVNAYRRPLCTCALTQTEWSTHTRVRTCEEYMCSLSVIGPRAHAYARGRDTRVVQVFLCALCVRVCDRYTRDVCMCVGACINVCACVRFRGWVCVFCVACPIRHPRKEPISGL